jgi:hypothetical protein
MMPRTGYIGQVPPDVEPVTEHAWRQQTALAWQGSDGTVWNGVPVGGLTDGASIPRWCWSIIGLHPLSPSMLPMTTIHDEQCRLQVRPWHVVHRETYAQLMSPDNPNRPPAWKARVVQAATMLAGPRWKVTP